MQILRKLYHLWNIPERKFPVFIPAEQKLDPGRGSHIEQEKVQLQEKKWYEEERNKMQY